MFQATQHRTFRELASLRHFKIHPPLPLSPRESKQLLNLLTTSFRQQLDREHGAFRTEPKELVGSSSNPACTKRRRYSQSRPEPRVPTDRHLHTVLTNPLFSYGPEKPSSEAKSLRDPMDIFDEACAKGFMKLEYAAACLKAKKQLIVKSSVLSVQDAIKSSQAGSKVLRWLLSSGVGNNALFLEDEAFSKILVEFLVAEELQVAIWGWIEEFFLAASTSQTQHTAESASKTAARILYTLVKAEASGFVSLDTAYASLRKASGRLNALGCRSRSILFKAGGFLSRESTYQLSLHPAPSPVMFDSFLNIVPTFTAVKDLHLSHLRLHHPTTPDASLALKLLEKVKEEVSLMAEGAHGPFESVLYPHSRIIAIGLDTARHLLERDQHAKARWVMNFLQETYAKQLGLTQKKQFEQAQAEASSLELLKNLNLA